MEKICTRCQFRNPPHRGVCQVCGYAKFECMATEQTIAAKQSTAPLSTVLTQTVAAVTAAIEKIGHTQKPNQIAEQQVVSNPLRSATREVPSIPATFESNDLDSMIAWFKSYGVDKPLILDQNTTAKDQQKAA